MNDTDYHPIREMLIGSALAMPLVLLLALIVEMIAR